MKKCILMGNVAMVLLLAALSLTIFISTAAATTISIGSGEAAPSGSVIVPLMINNVTDAGSVSVNLTYNPSVVIAVNVTNSSFDFKPQDPPINPERGYVVINAFKFFPPGLSGDVKIADVKLKAVGKAGQSSPLNLKDVLLQDMAMKDIRIDGVINGTFTIVAAPDTTSPLVTNPTATPSSIPADGTTPSQLNVTVTDDSGVASVTIDLSAIGGSAAQVMSLISDNVYSTTTTAAVGTPPGTYNLQVNATDIYGNSNTSVSIPLTVTEPKPTISIYTDKTSYTTGERMHLGLDVKNPLDSAQRVSFEIYLETPIGRNLTLIDTTVTLPAKLNYSNPDFKILKLPSIPTGTYTWHAILDDPVTGKIICEDTAEWEFVPTGGPTEDITTVLEQITVVIDFG